AVEALVAARDEKGAVALAREAVAARPDAIPVHVVYQKAMIAAGQEAALVAEYRERAERAPDFADAAYLSARLLHGEALRAAFDALAARWPDHAYIVRGRAVAQAWAGDDAGALASFARLRQLDAALWAAQVRTHARALVALRKLDEAAKILDEVLRDRA